MIGWEMESIRLKAMAKVNLGLDVVGKRQDGYHEVRMIMQNIKLFDQVFISKRKDNEIRIRTNLPFLPVNENNIAYKAARMLQQEFHLEQGVDIELKKHIPVAAGMAGGSSDAAAVFYGMNRLFRLDLNRTELMERGVLLGADIPYCLLRGTALSEGIGEKLSSLPPLPPCYILIGKPGISVSTKYVYENLDLSKIGRHPDIDGMVKALNHGDLNGICSRMENVLETVTVQKYPVIRQIKEEMISQGALNALMSGSGPTVFGIFDDQGKAQQAYRILKGGTLAKQVFLTNPFRSGGQ